MKNIYISESKSSSIYKNGQNKLIVEDNPLLVPSDFYPINIYIVSDEDIKNGDWAFEVNSAYPTGLPKVLKCKRRTNNEMIIPEGWTRRIKFPQSGVEMKKIILTTDFLLLNDNVQLITNSFVNWYLKYQLNYINIKSFLVCSYCGRKKCDNYRCNGHDNHFIYKYILP